MPAAICEPSVPALSYSTYLPVADSLARTWPGESFVLAATVIVALSRLRVPLASETKNSAVYFPSVRAICLLLLLERAIDPVVGFPVRQDLRSPSCRRRHGAVHFDAAFGSSPAGAGTGAGGSSFGVSSFGASFLSGLGSGGRASAAS